MLSRVISAAVQGIDSYLIDVEVDISAGLPTFSTVGLPDAAVKESKDRVVAAVRNSGFNFPAKRVTVNLAPADIKKEGACFDLPIAVGILAAMEKEPKNNQCGKAQRILFYRGACIKRCSSPHKRGVADCSWPQKARYYKNDSACIQRR